jgi:hypothetical protein
MALAPQVSAAEHDPDHSAARASSNGFSGGRLPNKAVDDPGAKPQAPKLELFARGSQG